MPSMVIVTLKWILWVVFESPHILISFSYITCERLFQISYVLVKDMTRRQQLKNGVQRISTYQLYFDFHDRYPYFPPAVKDS